MYLIYLKDGLLMQLATLVLVNIYIDRCHTTNICAKSSNMITITGFDFNALGDKDNKWVHYYDSVKNGMSNPFFILFPAFDTAYVHCFKKRKEVHDNLTKFLQNLDHIIDEKRKLVKQKTSVQKKTKTKIY